GMTMVSSSAARTSAIECAPNPAHRVDPAYPRPPWPKCAARAMADVLAADEETIVIPQIEEPEGVAAAAEITAVDGVDGLFVGPADLAVCYGSSDPAGPEVRAGIKTVSDAAKANGKSSVTFAPSNAWTADLTALGVNMFFFASDHTFIAQGAKATAEAFRDATG
ncbi:MAG: aldolase/citrate lyase family protein, partial [Pseudomonadota bacterium]